ncbi:MAG TPA: TIGR02588 family protein [Cyanobacteria bacterium UBA8803]|nr:TIGR02588 family protein [Cyanobacteria bacterium UBA9273]HBL57069.1 TIGR02588 family protein [Cyanobacteria bacterium UBA8803]
MVSDKPQQWSRSPAEWISFSIALSIVGLIVGLLVYRWVDGEDRPPAVSAVLDPEIREVDGQFYVPFKVTNTGGTTAESVQVIAEFTHGSVQEVGEQQIDFLSGGEVEEGAFVFSHNPREGQLTVRVASYKLP